MSYPFSLNASYPNLSLSHVERQERNIAFLLTIADWETAHCSLYGDCAWSVRNIRKGCVDRAQQFFTNSNASAPNRAAGKTLADYLSSFEKGDDLGNLCAEIEVYKKDNPKPVYTGIAKFLENHGILECGNCAEWLYAHSSLNTEDFGPVCDNCQDEFVEIEGEYYHQDNDNICSAWENRNSEIWIMRDDARDIGNRIVTVSYAEDLGYFWQNDNGEWVDYDPDEDEENEDEEGEHYPGVYDYHDHWMRHGAYFHEATKADNPAFGFELETYTDSDISENLESAGFEWILERDGSLDSTHGVEIISPPKTLVDWQETIPDFSEALRASNTEGWKNGYGMHVSIHKRHLTPLQQARIALFLTCEENRNFVVAIAQRQSIYCAAQDIGSISENSLQKFSAVKVAKKWRTVPFNLTENLGEFRIFQSNTKPERILKNLEFCAALVKWTGVKAATGSEYKHGPFVTWLRWHKAEYPNLCAYLSQDTCKVKDGANVSNTWGKI